MNFNLYLDRVSAARLGRLAKKTGRPRNALVREAVGVLLKQGPHSWPQIVAEFSGDPKAPRFEARRSELVPPTDEPFSPRLAEKRKRSNRKRKAKP